MRLTFIFGLLLFCGLPFSPVQAEEGAFEACGVRVRYFTSGQGDPVILLHGFAAPSSEAMWIENPLSDPQVVPELNHDFQVIAMDFRGHGKSGKPHGPDHYGMEMVGDVVRLMDHLKIKRAHVVGYSLGAMVAGKLLVTHPDRLLSVTLGGGAPVYQPTDHWAAIGEKLARSLDRGAGAGPLLSVIAPAGEAQKSPGACFVMGKMLVYGQDQKALASVIRGLPALEVTTEELRANKVPVFVIYGSREGEAKTRIGQVCEVLAQAEVKVIPDGDHMTTFARPEFRKGIHEFLNSQRSVR